MVTQYISMYLSIVRKIASFPIAKQFVVLLVFFFCTLFSFLSNTAFAQVGSESSVTLPNREDSRVILTPEEQNWLKAHPNIVLAYLDAAPEVIANPDGSYSGMLVDFLAELNRRLGTQIGLKIDTIPAILEQAKTKKVDGILEMLPEYADKLGLLKTATYLSAYPAIFGRHDVSYNEPYDCIGKKVAITDKTLFAEKIAEEYCGQATIVKVSLPLEGLRLVSQGDVDFFIGGGWNSYLIAKYQMFDIASKRTFFDLKSRFGMAIRPDWPELVSILNKGITSFTENEIDAIVAKWVHAPPQREFIVPTPEEKAWLSENQNVRVRATDWPPYMIINENMPPQGITVEYLKLIEERTGINFEYEVTKQSFAEFLKSMKEDQGPDMTAIIAPSPEREEYLSFSTPYIIASYVILARDQDEIFFDINDLAGKTVAVTKGHVMQQFLKKDFPEIELLLFDNDEQALLALSTGSSDAYIGDLTVSAHIIQKRGLSNLRVVASTPYDDQILSMGNRKDWPELTSILNKALASITEEEKTAIQNKFIAVKYEQGLDREKVMQWILILVLIATTILLLFVFWNRQLRRKVDVRTADLEAEIVERKQVVAALLNSEEKFRGLVEQSPLSIQILNLDGQIVQVNKAWHELWGISDEDLPEVLREYNMLEDQQAKDLGVLPLIKKAFNGENVTLPVIEYDASTTAGNLGLEHIEANKRWLQGRLYPIRNSQGEMVNVANIEEDITARKLAEKKILDHRQRLKSMAFQLIIAEEKERSRIAADLHDHIGQTLAFNRIQVAKAKKYASEEKLADALDEISRSLKKTIQDTKSMVFELSSPLLDELGLLSAIRHWLEENVTRKHGIEFELIGDKVRYPLSKVLKSLLFRNVRELLTNVIRHAQASKVIVSLVESETELKVVVSDDGAGFDIRELKEKEGGRKKFGLFSIREQMEDMGGSIEIISNPGNGCRTILSITLEPNNEQATEEL